MNPNGVAPMVIGITLFVVTGGVLVLRPLARRLGDYLEVLASNRLAEQKSPTDTRLVEALNRVEDRLRMIEERQDFTEAMLASGGRRKNLRTAKGEGEGEGEEGHD